MAMNYFLKTPNSILSCIALVVKYFYKKMYDWILNTHLMKVFLWNANWQMFLQPEKYEHHDDLLTNLAYRNSWILHAGLCTA